MSVRAMTWVWEHADASGTGLLVMLALADAADDTGRNAWPSVATLAAKTRLNERTVQRILGKLVACGLVTRTAGGGRWSNTYTLVMSPPAPPAPPEPTDTDPQPDDPPTPGTDIATEDDGRTEPGEPCQSGRPGPSASSRRRHPNGTGPAVRKRPFSNSGRLSTPPAERHPRQSATGGAAVSPQGWHSYAGAGVAQLCHPTRPITVLDPSTSPDTPARPAEPALDDGGGGDPPTPAADDPGVAEVLAALPPAWRLGPRSARRLAPLIRDALAAGWAPADLAAHLAVNPDGVQSPYAVLTSRLRDLPTPTTAAPRWPTWCGHCAQATRLRELPDGRVARCAACHPERLANEVIEA